MERLGHCFLRFVSSTHIPLCASTPNIQGKNRVREQRSHGSVRGSSNRHPTATCYHKSARFIFARGASTLARIFACNRKFIHRLHRF